MVPDQVGYAVLVEALRSVASRPRINIEGQNTQDRVSVRALTWPYIYERLPGFSPQIWVRSLKVDIIHNSRGHPSQPSDSQTDDNLRSSHPSWPSGWPVPVPAMRCQLNRGLWHNHQLNDFFFPEIPG